MRRIAALTMMVVLAFPWLTQAQEVIPAPVNQDPFSDPAPLPPATPEPKKPSLLEGIQTAKQLLQARIDQKKPSAKPVIVSSSSAPRNVTLAIWNGTNGEVSLVDAVKDGVKLDVKTAFDHKIKVTSNNGVNSHYLVVDAPDELVVGIIYPMAKDMTVKKKKPQFELIEKTYVPYNEAFYKPEVLRKGSDYLSYLLKGAYDELRLRGVKSRAFPDKLLSDIADPYLVKSIAVIEHADGQIYQDTDPDRALGRFLVTLALNDEDAFDFSVSSAGARGLVQFMPKTYAMLAKKRPELNLIQDFVTAMGDHTNAVKAQMALLDENLALMPKAVRQIWLTDRGHVAPFLAAAYNGGSTRVTKSYAIWGDAWSEYRMPQMDVLQAKADSMDARMKQLKKLIAKKTTTAKELKQYKSELAKLMAERPDIKNEYAAIKKYSLHKETAQYVSKLNTVYSMLSAGYFATPNASDGGLGREIATNK